LSPGSNEFLVSTKLLLIYRKRVFGDLTDAIFIGPNDLAMSMLGYAPAHYTEEPYLAAIEKVRQAGKVAGVKVGILAPDGVKGRAFRGRFDMVGCGGDVKAMQGWMQKAMRDVLSTEE
jgi:2-keto-3-deoxy-L-rhamnonate aldolase RhmA